MTTYDKFDIFISKFINEDVSMDFWYDFANIESINMINKFTKNDWSKLLKEVNNKNYLWKIRLLESFDSSNWKEKKIIILEIIKSCDNDELLLIIIDYLRSIKESIIHLDDPNFINKLTILSNKSEVNRSIINNFLKKSENIL